MAAAVVETRATSEETSVTASHTVTLPAGVISGELLIVVFAMNTAETVVWPGSWLEFATRAQNNAKYAAAWLEATGGETSITVTTTGTDTTSSHASLRISGAADPDTQPPEALDAGTTSAAPDPPSLTPTGGEKDYLWIVACNSRNGADVDGFPTSYINDQTLGNNPSVATAERTLTASVEDPDAFSIDISRDWCAATIAVHPGGIPGAIIIQNT